MVFRVYGCVCAVFLVLFLLVNLYNRSEGSFSADMEDHMDPKNVSWFSCIVLFILNSKCMLCDLTAGQNILFCLPKRIKIVQKREKR